MIVDSLKIATEIRKDNLRLIENDGFEETYGLMVKSIEYSKLKDGKYSINVTLSSGISLINMKFSEFIEVYKLPFSKEKYDL